MTKDEEIKSLSATCNSLRAALTESEKERERTQQGLKALTSSVKRLDEWYTKAENLERECDSLRAEVEDFSLALRCLLEDKPHPNGEYVHLLICSGNRSKPTGSDGCICQPRIKKLRRGLATAHSKAVSACIEVTKDYDNLSAGAFDEKYKVDTIAEALGSLQAEAEEK